MTTPADLQALLRAEKLDEAIEHLNAEVKKNPTAIDRRAQLAELLCVAGNLDRADTVLNAITDIDPGAMVGVALFRQLVRAEQARQQFYAEGRLPEFVTKPDALLELELRAEEKAARLPAIMTVPLILFILPVLFVVILGPAACSIADAFGSKGV